MQDPPSAAAASSGEAACAGAGLQLEALAFDLDGTLIDSAPDIHAALNQALAAQGLEPVGAAQVRGWIGDGPDRLIECALQAQQVVLTPTLGRALRSGFDAATLASPLAAGGVFPGIAELLARWHGRLPLAVVTNKPSALSRSVLAAAGLLGRFDLVLGADRLEQRKPGPALLHAAARALEVPAARLLMVGDSRNDLLSAQRAGCPALWVTWGYGGADCAAMASARAASAAEAAEWIGQRVRRSGG